MRPSLSEPYGVIATRTKEPSFGGPGVVKACATPPKDVVPDLRFMRRNGSLARTGQGPLPTSQNANLCWGRRPSPAGLKQHRH